jgi:RNA 2',3'-cyclic 3'-phosphodiesterase
MEVFMGFSRPTDRLLFLVYADPAAAAAAVEAGFDLRDEYGLKGLPLLPQHIHSTLWHVGDDFFPPPAELVAALIERAKRVAMASFRVSFDRVESFSGGALVLRGEEGVVGLEMLHEHLKVALGIKGKKLRQASFTPHVTLLRDKRRLLPSMPVEPIEWTVREFVLVHSLLGKTTHRVLARFPLISPPLSDRGR